MRSLLLAAALLASFANTLHAQEAPSPGGPPPASDAPAQPVDIGDVETLKVNVNLVNLYFSVRDKSGYITNLHKETAASSKTRFCRRPKTSPRKRTSRSPSASCSTPAAAR